MDPFTEKLLERTRARRENLQKKMAERPNAANRQMVKRPREPLADTNSLICEPSSDKVPQAVTKPSPSKRKCSGENMQPVGVDEENKEQMVPRSVAPLLQDPLTDRKPPVGPASIRSTPSLEKKDRPAVTSTVEQQPKNTVEPEKKPLSLTDHATSSREEERMEMTTPSQTSNEDALSASGMRSRLQRLANQRKCWDGDSVEPVAVPDCTPLSMLKRQANVPLNPAPPASSGTPVGRKGRLANLAATIGSWEDDLSHANIAKQNPQVQPATASVPQPGTRETSGKLNNHAVTSSASGSKSTITPNLPPIYCPVKPSRVTPPSPQKTEVPAFKPTTQSPQKLSKQELSYASSPQKECPKPVPQSPLKTKVQSSAVGVMSSPQNPEIRAKPADLSFSNPQDKTAGTPGVKTFLERFGERCQERSNLRTNPSTPAGGSTHPKTPAGAASVTPNTRLVQEKLRAAQSAQTATADLTQRQKLERESELAQIRSRFQKANNLWKNKDEENIKTIVHTTEPISKSEETEAASSHAIERTHTPTKSFLDTLPASTSSPLRSVSQIVEETANENPDKEKKEEKAKEIEMNVDHSFNSAVINELFEGVLDQSEDQTGPDEEDEEEDGLNISSMSLLAPLADTVAAVSKSPERMMTSTPASSFIMKNTPEKIKKTNLRRSLSSDNINVMDPDHKLPYSIDAYRSIRVKDTERPSVKQVIVRKEEVSQRTEAPRAASLFSIKQKMKILTNDMNLQQTVIHQASQALNCCTDEEHGKGSQVEAEAERLLLVATEKREALKAELDRLKGDPSGQKNALALPDQAGLSASKGSISLQELRLPLKADFVCSTANKPESTKHSFFVMIRAGAENTVATPLASTHRGLSGDTLTFPTNFSMSDVSSDFQIRIEVYCLVQKREICTDKKKKISKSKMMWQQVYEAHDLCMSAITPKRFLAITKSGQTPVVASPGGPNAIRTSNFIMVGSHMLTLSSIGKNKFQLEKVPFLCPLEGHIYLKMQCEVGSNVEEKGFLTMFEDVSGFGAWHRRWCVLSGYCITYWTYPDDEKRKNPIGRINLANCTSKRVEPANREFCARPNTFELITVRPQKEDDRETLVSQCMNTMCVTKNWLSADTKDERNLWMKKLNQILVDLRMWQPDSCYKPL